MHTQPENPLAFPADDYAESGMSLRDWFATFAPPPPEWWVNNARTSDSQRCKNNERYQMRGPAELDAKWRYEHANAMLAERQKGTTDE